MAQPELCIIGGNAHPTLTNLIADHLEISPLKAKVEKFADGETNVEIESDVRDMDVFIVQPTGPPANENIMEGLILIDALRRASAKRITAVIPYFGYARQDRKETSRKPITAKMVTNLFSGDDKTGVDRFLTVDLHSDQIQGFTDLPFDNLYARYIIAEHLAREVEDPLIFAPDVGAGKKAREIAKLIGVNEWGIVDKDRQDDTHTTIAAFIGQGITGRNAVIVDDMATTCSTLMGAARALKEEGAAWVAAAVTHGVFCGDAVQAVSSSPDIDAIYYTNTLANEIDDPKFHEIGIDPLLADAIQRVHHGKSLRSLFRMKGE